MLILLSPAKSLNFDPPTARLPLTQAVLKDDIAILDGYTRKRAFVMVALPIVRPGIAAAALLAFIFAWNNYVFPLILADTNAGTVTVAITKFLGGGGQAYYNLTAAAAIIAALPPLILALTIQRYLVRGLSFGAVKA